MTEQTATKCQLQHNAQDQTSVLIDRLLYDCANIGKPYKVVMCLPSDHDL